MACPYLEYRRAAGGTSFDHERAYCTVVDRFVQPMRADLCNDRHGLDHVAHCEFYREAADLGPLEGLQAGTPTAGSGDHGGDGA
jgi:hypothetical protein